MRTQVTFLCSDFEMYAYNKQVTFPLTNALLDKGWSALVRIAPTVNEPMDFQKSERVILKERIQALPEDQRVTATVHIHLCLQAIVFESLAIPLHESSMDARSDVESTLKQVYIQNIVEILKLVPRPPIVMINHDRRFYACAHRTLRQREDFPGYDAACAYITMELRLRGCVVVHGSSFWCKMVSSLRDGEYGAHVLSTDKISGTEPHPHHHRAFALCEKHNSFARR